MTVCKLETDYFCWIELFEVEVFLHLTVFYY